MHHISSETGRHHRAIAIWLFVMCAMVFAMVVLGGVTRLTNSGLSMVEWRPITGWLPPLGDQQWADVFARYRLTPEYAIENAGMSVAQFKSIFWLEFLHRLWGRMIGIAFFVPMVVFMFRGWVDRPLAPKLIVMFILGGLQGVLGWYMVKSGLVDRPDVSQYRLTAHLGAALLILGYMFWVALGLLRSGDGLAEPSDTNGTETRGGFFLTMLAVLISVTILSGGLVAGLDAGLAYNTFPLMDGELIPSGLFAMSPLYLNFFEDITTVQFDHRLLALIVTSAVAYFWFRARHSRLARRQRMALNALALMVVIQVALGIATLLSFIATPLAAAHQAGAVILFTIILWTVWEYRVVQPGPDFRKGP